jgi:hypothetical protein
LILASLAACTRTTTHFQSFAPVAQLQIVDEILVVNDLRPLMEHGGVVLGMVDGHTKYFAGIDALLEAVMTAAARAGGTHVLVRRSRDVDGMSKGDECGVLHCHHHASRAYSWAALDFEGDTGVVYVVRVPPERWAELPPELRPVLRVLASPTPMH